MHSLAQELKPLGISVLLLHSGWMRTRTDGSSAPVSPEESVRGMLALVDRHAPNLSGALFGAAGARMPW